ncbi:hypothetical protein [Saccharothrix coeruleofusca]|uniref:Uncharacterized protein n=1 Tax=Saccharothrix coeruleofusca TaxID=33919 RepID=A0A918ECD9_9PSEU|nr:hypothetical protein [Saccharothrix coeruleofusca]MBP2338348.1 hypothetical protein [Saccharothrix coeruleofusca]GGP48963.1 hypothetical protein GCM10010185_21360 [Saccharothrix coeruleofusca]
MLFVVLLLVLAALGLLVPALTTTSTPWAWWSVAASGAAAVVLVLDWWRHRRPATGDRPPAPVATGPAPERGQPSTPDDEPAEEQTDAADLLVVTDLAEEVRVLDERPRYHLATCSWLGERASLGLPVSEARELGFTPCGVCLPDSALAAAQRASS